MTLLNPSAIVMGSLSTENLVKGLETGRPLVPFSIGPEIIDSYIKLIQAERRVLRTDSEEANCLARHIQEPISFVQPGRRKDLSQCEIYVLPFPLCMAYAEEPNKPGAKPKIIIGSGLIDLIANTIFLSHLESLLPPELNEIFLLKFRKDMPASHLFTNALFVLHLRFFRFCEPLPNIFGLLTPEMVEASKTAINGALVFTLLHELGHHQLNHFGKNQRLRPLHYQFAVNEDLSTLQQQELEADHFAMDSLIEPAKIMGTFWNQHAVTFFMQLEVVSGRHNDEKHPMALNRSYYSDTLRKDWGQEFDVASRPDYFKETARRFHETGQSKIEDVNALIQTPREGCLNILHEICGLLKEFGLDFNPLLSTPSPNWLGLMKTADEES